jgi:DNA-binding CsgD family transcriptional regulator
MDEDWEFWTRAEAFHLTDYEGGSYSNWTMKYIRESLTEEGSKAAVEVLRQVDVTPLLPKVQAPTLIFHRAGIRSITVEMAREMATTIPNARLVMLDGSWIVPYLPDGGQDIADAWRAFLREPGHAPREAASHPASLTPRETEVLRLVAAGRTSKEISADLSVSVRTVGRHITNIYTKIGARTRADATAYAIRHDLA